MHKRHPVAVVGLSFFTFTLYAYYWLYVTTQELREETGNDRLNPITDVLLAILTMGLWGLWAGYRNAKIAHVELLDRGVEHSDHSIAIAAFGGLTFFTGWAWLVSMAIVQQDLNRLAESEDIEYDDAEIFESTVFTQTEGREPIRARVVLEKDPAVVAAAEPAEAKAGWDEAPSAPVFRSNAPAPDVF